MNYHKVLWQQGTLLAPHHLQLADRYYEAQHRSFRPHEWGLIELQIDHGALAQSRFQVRRCSAILPDGLRIDWDTQHGEEFPPPPSIPIEFPPGVERIGVWLTLPDTMESQRYLQRQREFVDELEPTNRRTVVIGQPNLAFVTSGQSLEGLVALKLAEVGRSVIGVPMVSEDYLPPSLTLSTTPFYSQLLDQLLGQLENKLRYLLKTQRKTLGSEWAACATLAQQLPVLHAMAAKGSLRLWHPAQLYHELVRLCGGLAVVGDELLPMPSYQHDDQRACFLALQARLRTLLGLLTPSLVQSYPLLPRAGFEDFVVWDGIMPALSDGKAKIYLELSGDFALQDFVPEVPSRGKLGGMTALDRALEGGWPGLPLEFVPAPPKLSASNGNAIYFRLRQESCPRSENGVQENDRLFELWSELRDRGRASFYLPQIFLGRRRPRVTMHVLKEGEER